MAMNEQLSLLPAVAPEPPLTLAPTEGGKRIWVMYDGHTLAIFDTVEQAETFKHEYRQLWQEDRNYGY